MGRPLFLALYDYFKDKGGIYKLAFGPKTFMIVSDPVIAKARLIALTLLSFVAATDAATALARSTSCARRISRSTRAC